jgi:CBS domain-containing membrane protein
MTIRTVADLMTDVVETLSPTDNVLKAARGMRLGNIRHLPVVDETEQLVGLVTHSQIVAVFTAQGRPGADQTSVESIMERNVISVEPSTTAIAAAHLIETHKFGCLPVVNDGKLIGIVTEHDFVRLARIFLESQP